MVADFATYNFVGTRQMVKSVWRELSVSYVGKNRNMPHGKIDDLFGPAVAKQPLENTASALIRGRVR
jgi:hypothetical protein